MCHSVNEWIIHLLENKAGVLEIVARSGIWNRTVLGTNPGFTPGLLPLIHLLGIISSDAFIYHLFTHI